MTGEEDFTNKEKGKEKHSSAILIIAWCDLNINKMWRLHDYCPNPKSKCQKQRILFSKQFQMEGAEIKNIMKEIFKSIDEKRSFCFKLCLKIATPIISAGVAAKTKNPQSAQMTSIILNSLPGGKNLSLIDMHGKG